MKIQMNAALLLAAIALPLAPAIAQAKDYGPRICVDARFWNTPGWTPRDGDSAYLRVTPGGTPVASIRAALGPVPAAARMLRVTTIEGLESALHQLIEVEGFKLGSLGYEATSRGAIANCDRARALAQRFGLALFVFTTREYAGDLAHRADVLSIQDNASPGEERNLYQTLLSSNPKAVIFQKVTAAEGITPRQMLRNYRENADQVGGILVDANSPARAGTLLRAIRPELGRKYAVAPGEGPSVYFFSFHWKMPGWQPRPGDYAVAKIRPQLKTFEEKVAYVLRDLRDVAPQNRMVQVNSLSGLAELLKEVVEARHFKLACIGYDLENWDLTTGDEKKDPIAACKYGQALANHYGMDFIVTTDMPMSHKWGKQVAPFINAIKPQAKGLEAEDIDKAIAYQRNLAIEIRRANPDIRILHDVGIAPKGKLQTPEALLRYYAGVAGLVDGIGVFSLDTPEQDAVMRQYIVGVRPPLAQQNGAAPPKAMVVSRLGIVATKNALASQTGAMILEQGGNAVDAAVAANAMLGLLDPSISGTGGDLFAIVYVAKTKKLYGLNSSGWTPAGMTIEFLQQKGLAKIPPRSIYTVTVPGAVAGWDALESRFGKLGLARALAPAIHYAEDGVAVSETLASNLAGAQRPTLTDPNIKATYFPSGRSPRVGELFRNPGLAASLRRIAERGREGFYRGPTAEAIVRLSKERGGAMTLADLDDFRPEWVDPISTTYRGWSVSELPPNSYGFAALAMLNVMERFPLSEYGHNSAKSLHIMIEAKKLAYANIMQDLGDPRFSRVPTAALISKSLAETRAKSIDPEHAHCSVLPAELTAAANRIGQDTIYLSAVDAEGTLVSLIESNGSGWGSGLVPPGCGFVLHDRGGGFSMDPHSPNGLAGHKRPVHTNMPGFMAKGDVRIAFGIMLGWNQAQAQAQFVSNIVDFGMSVQDAMSAARFSKRTFPGCDVTLESRIPDSVRSELTRLGHELQMQPPFTRNMGVGQAVMRDPNGVNYGGTDPRVANGAAVAQNPPFRGADRPKSPSRRACTSGCSPQAAGSKYRAACSLPE